MRRFLLSLSFLVSHASLMAADLTEPQTISSALFPVLDYQRQGEAFPLPLSWRYTGGDKLAYAKASFDDSKWREVEIGRPISGQGWRWYRLKFDLPEALSGKNLLLSLGAISVADQVYLNGEKVGEFGGTPPFIAMRASDVSRLYPIPAKHWKPGENTIAVRVFAGVKGGMYTGPYSLQAYDDTPIYSQFNQKIRGEDALERLLFDTPIQQQFAPGAPIIIEPQLTRLNAKAVIGNLSAVIKNAEGNVVESDSVDLILRGMLWNGARFRFKAEDAQGTYTCEVSYKVEGKTLWSQELPFTVKPSQKTTYELAQDSSIKDLPATAFPASISSVALGRYGPREINEDRVLFDDLSKTDARSGTAYTAHIERSLGGPRLFLANTRPTPIKVKRSPRFHRVAGSQYDGLGDSWIYGMIRPAGESPLKDLEIKETSWAKRTYYYRYQDGAWLDYSVSVVSPAWVVNSSSRKLSVFQGIEEGGIGLPSHLAYQTENGVKVVRAEEGVDGKAMTANWILAWFSGSEGWQEFDTPYLFVLEHRPETVQGEKGNGLIFSYAKPSGMLQGMPLYGVTLQSLVSTRAWSESLPVGVVTRCSYWSKVLVHAPDQILRSSGADFENDLLVVRDEISHLDIKDDWSTQGVRIAPVSPTLALSAKSGKIDIAAAIETRDLDLATLHGPYVAAEHERGLTFRIKGLLKWAEKQRESVPFVSNEKTKAIRASLNKLVAEGLEKELKVHPWAGGVQHQTFIPGRHRVRFSNLLLALPYLDQPLRDAVVAEMQKETETYFLSTEKPPRELARQLNKADQELPLLVNIYNPLNQLTIAMAPYGVTRFGIDQPYFGAMNLYMCWHYAEATQRFDWLANHYPTLQHLFNAVRNSHDWSTGVSWDSLSGLRVGNGHQESGGIHAAMVAIMRTAKKMEDDVTVQASAYYALMQIVGMQAQIYASEYIRQNRPWLHANTRRDQIEYAQKIRGNYFAEFNEFSGFSQAIISSGNIASRPDNLSGSSPNGLVESPLPEVMRLYQALWPDFIDDFYDPKYDAVIKTDRMMDPNISVDTFVYQIASYPRSIDEIFQIRSTADYSWWIQMTDHRAYLDYLNQKAAPASLAADE